jgi:hypothetical protein
VHHIPIGGMTRRVSFEAALARAQNPRTSLEDLATPAGFGILQPAGKLLTKRIALRSPHDAAMHSSTHPEMDMGSGVA